MIQKKLDAMENNSDYYIGNWHDKQYKEELKELAQNNILLNNSRISAVSTANNEQSLYVSADPKIPNSLSPFKVIFTKYE